MLTIVTAVLVPLLCCRSKHTQLKDQCVELREKYNELLKLTSTNNSNSSGGCAIAAPHRPHGTQRSLPPSPLKKVCIMHLTSCMQV
jgi:hypothetical protein